jgi:hypothetical protein
VSCPILKQPTDAINGCRVLSLIYRTRKDRYSARAKTPLIETREIEMPMSPEMIETINGTIVDIAKACQSGLYPRLGIRTDTCSWCPNGRLLQNKPLCLYPDNILREFAQTSLQRASSERWRDEF